MLLHHKTPCSECPWRKTSAKGWLGGYPAEQYADAVQENEVPACHNRDFGPDEEETAFCVGALHTAANQCVSLWKSENADVARKVVGKSSDTFSHVRDFYAHHTGKEYTLRMFR